MLRSVSAISNNTYVNIENGPQTCRNVQLGLLQEIIARQNKQFDST